MVNLYGFFCVLCLSITSNKGTHYEEGTFFKYRIYYTQKLQTAIQQTDALQIILHGITFQCRFDNEEHLYNNYSPNLNMFEFSGVIQMIPPIRLVTESWLYEIIPNEYILQQYMIDPLENYLLGFYSHAYFSTKRIKSLFEKEQVYYTQVYENGTLCKTTGFRRKTEVRFICSLRVKDRITHMIEISTCNYVFFVYSPRICAVYGFGNVFVHPVYCYTSETVNMSKVLSETEFAEGLLLTKKGYTFTFSDKIENSSKMLKRRNLKKIL